MKYRILLVAIVLSGLLLGGCGGRRSRPTPARLPYLEHSVKYAGETLGLISKWYTGSEKNWERILHENPGLDVYRLKKGMLIFIPSQMVIREDPLPASAVRYVPVKKKEEVNPVVTTETPSPENPVINPEQPIQPILTPLHMEPPAPPEKILPQAGRGAALALPPMPENSPRAEEVRKKSREELLQELLETP